MKDIDQIVPYLSVYLFAERYPGVAGIYMSAVFGASLSTISSGLNSQSTVMGHTIFLAFRVNTHCGTRSNVAFFNCQGKTYRQDLLEMKSLLSSGGYLVGNLIP